MKPLAKIEAYFSMIERIRYNNPHGGAYAYVQFLAYARELVKLLRPFKKVERQIDSIEAVSWLFNEYLAVSFTHRQQVIFETKMTELKDVFNSIRLSLKQAEMDLPLGAKVLHRQAA
jgi:hypothetical protein